MTDRVTDNLLIGAGPFGLALSAYAKHLGANHLVVGTPMAFWRAHMPEGMYLRSASDWHLDPLDIHTLDAYLATRHQSPGDAHPISRATYLNYCNWFQRHKGVVTIPESVIRLDQEPDGQFRVTLGNGETIGARRVVLAIGFGAFSHVPAELAANLPAGRFSHTRDSVRFGEFAGKRVVIVGGRQSAHEWASLLHEAGAAEVHIVHRQGFPVFAESEWSWVAPMVDRMIDDPGWYRRLPSAEQESIVTRLYAEGRLKIEPWLESRVIRDGIRRWPNSCIATCAETRQGDLAIHLDNDERIRADHIILATGYKVQIDRVPFLAQGNIMAKLETRNGFPVLSEHFETSVPGLAVTSMPATQDFGPFFGFTIAVRMSARVIGDHFLGGNSGKPANSAGRNTWRTGCSEPVRDSELR